METFYSVSGFIFAVVVFLIPWISIYDIHKSMDRQTGRLERLIDELQDIYREVKFIRYQVDQFMEEFSEDGDDTTGSDEWE